MSATRTAIISDLHANALGLEAVLADAARAGYDQLVCLGDVATMGPRPREVLDRLKDLRCPCILGNHDEYLLEPKLGENEPAVIVDSENVTRTQLTEDDFAFIRGFARSLEMGPMFLFHGTPRSNTEDLLSTTPNERVDEMLGGHRARVFIGGHTHLQMLRQHRGLTLVNVGSVGMAFREYANRAAPVVMPYSEYAIIEVSGERTRVDLRRIELDHRALIAEIEAWDNPMARELRGNLAV